MSRPERHEPQGQALATVEIGRDSMITEIENLAWTEADLMPGEDEHAKHQLRDIAQDGNKARLLRSLDLAHQEIISALYPFTRRPVSVAEEGEAWRDTLKTSAKWAMELAVPRQFSQTSLDYITLLTREFMCCMAMADWLGIAYPTDPGRRSLWLEKAQAAMAKLKSEKSRVCDPSRKRRGMSWA